MSDPIPASIPAETMQPIPDEVHKPALGSFDTPRAHTTGPREGRHRGRASNCNIYICGIPPQWTNETLAELFSQFGTVVTSRVCSRPGNASGGQAFGFALMTDSDSAATAVRALHGTMLDGRRLEVRAATRKAPMEAAAAKAGSGGILQAPPNLSAPAPPAFFTSHHHHHHHAVPMDVQPMMLPAPPPSFAMMMPHHHQHQHHQHQHHQQFAAQPYQVFAVPPQGAQGLPPNFAPNAGVLPHPGAGPYGNTLVMPGPGGWGPTPQYVPAGNQFVYLMPPNAPPPPPTGNQPRPY